MLRLLETFEIDEVHAAVRQALQLGAIVFDAVKHLVLCRIERRPPRLDLDVYPYLPRARVETTSAQSKVEGELIEISFLNSYSFSMCMGR